MSSLCVQCVLAYSTREELVEHIRSPLHSYNLRRCSDGLPPLLPAEYERKLKLLEEGGVDIITGKKTRRGNRDKFTNVNLSESAANISDVENVAGEEEDSDESSEFEEPAQYDLTMSLFDSHISSSYEENLEYMDEHFSFRIHDEKYCVDVAQFIQYLGEKVYDGHCCLYCNHGFVSADACKQHMVDKGHRRIGNHLDEHVEEYAMFYDYRTSFKDLKLPEAIMSKLSELENGEVNEGVEADDTATTWIEKLTALGYQRPSVTQEGDLYLGNFDKTLVHRKNHVAPVNSRRIASKTKSVSHAILAISNSGELTKSQRADVRRAMNDFNRNIYYTQVHLGVKSNSLYRYIARKNKIFI